MFQERVASRLGTLTLRLTVCFAAAVVVAMFANAPACAESLLQHPVVRHFQPVRIALPDFFTGSPADAELARAISRIIATDLKRSGVFVPIAQAALLEKNVNVDVLPQFADWRAIKAQELITGRVIRQPDGRIKVEFRLWDVFGGTQLVGSQYFGAPDDFSTIGHTISDAIYERVNGQKASFGSLRPD